MQINSINTHAVAIISELVATNLIVSIFENDLKIQKRNELFTFKLNKNQQTGNKSIADYELEKAYEHLITLPDFSDYEIAEGKNWKFDDEIIRLIVDKNKLTPHLLSADAVGQLVQYVLADPAIKDKTIDNANESFIYIYLIFLLPEHEAIILDSDCIVIDYK